MKKESFFHNKEIQLSIFWETVCFYQCLIFSHFLFLLCSFSILYLTLKSLPHTHTHTHTFTHISFLFYFPTSTYLYLFFSSLSALDLRLSALSWDSMLLSHSPCQSCVCACVCVCVCVCACVCVCVCAWRRCISWMACGQCVGAGDKWRNHRWTQMKEQETKRQKKEAYAHFNITTLGEEKTNKQAHFLFPSCPLTPV